MNKEHSRFNLILHESPGLVPTDGGLDIFVPFDEPEKADQRGEEHRGFWGLPDSFLPIPDSGIPGVTRRFEVCIPGYDTQPPPVFPSADQFVRFDHMKPVDSAIRARISVPTPDVIRGFRYMEFPRTVASNHLKSGLRVAPLVIVFSWTSVSGPPHITGHPISIGGVPGYKVPLADILDAKGSPFDSDHFYNFCIYFEPFKAHQGKVHKPFDDMFEDCSTASLKTDYVPDGPPVRCSPESGIRPEHLLGLTELGVQIQSAKPNKFDLGSSDACGPAFVD